MDSGASHCFLSRELAAQLPMSCLRAPQAGRPPAVRQVNGSLRETGGAATAQLLLGGLDEETASVKFDVDCDADIILGYNSDLNFLHDSDVVCLRADGCTLGRRVRLDLALDAPVSPATRLSPAEDRAQLGTVGGRSASARCRCSAVRPSALSRRGAARPCQHSPRWSRQPGLRTRWPALPTRARRPATPRVRRAGRRVCRCVCRPAARPASGMFEVRIETGTHPMPRSRPMKRWSQGELDECRKQVPSCTSHSASVTFAWKPDGTWRFCQDSTPSRSCR